MSNETLKLAMDLIGRESVTPNDAGCQDLVGARLKKLGFHVEHMPAGDVSNLWCRLGDSHPVLCLAGHTDVVPTGNLDFWNTPPFVPTIADNKLYGRGAADMKASVAAMVVAVERFVAKHEQPAGSIAFLITSDEEGRAIDGTRHVMDQLNQRNELFDWCVVGEPSSHTVFGDTIRIGRRGSFGGTMTVEGTIGHVAYPQLTPNVVHHTLPILQSLANRQWDSGNEAFSPTTFQISNLRAGTGANNVIPGEVSVDFNFRYNTEQTPDSLSSAIEKEFSKLAGRFQYRFECDSNSKPFISKRGEFMCKVFEVVQETTGVVPVPSTSGGTSDGRFIVPCGVETVELGPVNASIHKYNEHIAVDELDVLTDTYEAILERLLV